MLSRVVEDDLSLVKELQLEMLDRMQIDSSKYAWRVVEQVSFLRTGGQSWERQVQLILPTVPEIPPHDNVLNSEQDFVVSLGTFRRRRFADFLVTASDGTPCHLLTRRQHGFCLATCLLSRHFSDKEWDGGLDSDALKALHAHLASLITDMSSSKAHTPEVAQQLLLKLFESSGIVDKDRVERASRLFLTDCEAMTEQTQYLCWVRAKPGTPIYLSATYTQSDSPILTPEMDGVTKSKLRLRWRNWRVKLYAKCKLGHLRYTFATPGYNDCRSYYFTISPPARSYIAVLDWGDGRRFGGPIDTDDEIQSNAEPNLPVDVSTELDCARLVYHFYNRRFGPDRHGLGRRGSGGRRQEGPAQAPPDRRKRCDRRQADDRRKEIATGRRLHTFICAEPSDNGKLVAIGFLGLCLAVLAGRGELFSSGGNNPSQWLLLAPAALVVFVAQQGRHHYAWLTTSYRLTIWIYIVLATVFAGSIAFGAPAIPLLTQGDNHFALRAISGVFAIASGILIVASGWSGRYFEWTLRKRCLRSVERVRLFATPSIVDEFRCFRYKPKYWRKPTQQLSAPEVRPEDRRNHPSDKIYAALARHSIDRLLGISLVGSVIVGALMAFNWGWGSGEECAASKQHSSQVAAEEGKPLGPGYCKANEWHHTPARTASASHSTSSAPRPALVRTDYAGSYRKHRDVPLASTVLK